jgi:prepilin-type N-terminal cleavage/methylation domain-containing protein
MERLERGEQRRTRGPRVLVGRKGRRGFTLIELAISMSILLIGIVSVVSATSRMHSLRKHNRERAVAQNALRSVGEGIHSRSFRLSRQSPNSWARDLIGLYGPAGTIGATFDVTGINLDLNQGAIGTIQIVTDETATDADLGYQIGMPRDLNGDGDADDVDVSGDARILPVLLQIQWRGQGGSNTVQQAFYVMGY